MVNLPGDECTGEEDRRGEGESEAEAFFAIEGARLGVLKVMPSRFLSSSALGMRGLGICSEKELTETLLSCVEFSGMPGSLSGGCFESIEDSENVRVGFWSGLEPRQTSSPAKLVLFSLEPLALIGFPNALGRLGPLLDRAEEEI